ncbi:hypothetical protein [Photobacterium lutimaris]|uniref:TIGR03751 family conjugal transfer lipoprotein n=1 Tax=Photobacterium lutimaris TaxID=388278 RepID=A0A2T3ITV5_9GAMM|nr:hypothetical protein [Photobacterium lutimaris]PSU31795.1 hypothetical protein C9I99_21665 [Photobacterium lutimaris]TDR72552.1 conjugative transfer region lipoprotein (TIGR03751 family) [Photobacterium lutimaris]
MNKIITILAVATIITGCSSKEPLSREERYQNSPIPESSRTMQEIYDNHSGAKVNAENTQILRRSATWAELSNDPYTLNNTGRADFRKLPNPKLYIYFAPSLTKEDRMPRPGWMSEFNMYSKPEYALPGEVSLEAGR